MSSGYEYKPIVELKVVVIHVIRKIKEFYLLFESSMLWHIVKEKGYYINCFLFLLRTKLQ